MFENKVLGTVTTSCHKNIPSFQWLKGVGNEFLWSVFSVVSYSSIQNNLVGRFSRNFARSSSTVKKSVCFKNIFKAEKMIEQERALLCAVLRFAVVSLTQWPLT